MLTRRRALLFNTNGSGLYNGRRVHSRETLPLSVQGTRDECTETMTCSLYKSTRAPPY